MRRDRANRLRNGKQVALAASRSPRGRSFAIFGAFALSGCAGLIYQSIWAQYLGLFLGHAAYAQSLVLAIFMGGLAAGAWWTARYAAAWRNLLRAYAVVELLLGLAAAVFHPTYHAATAFAYDNVFPLLVRDGPETLFKWSLATLLILPQSVLLGSTFPLLSNALMRRLPPGSGGIVGGLYFSNSIGAAAGALIATFVLLPAAGLQGAMNAGALLNLTVALIAFALAREPEVAVPIATEAKRRIDNRAKLVLLAAAFVTGATSFAYEIGWVRMLSLAFGSTVHAFELMLAAFIGGLACGALWIRRRADLYDQPLRVGGFVQLLMGLAALASLVLYDHCFDAVAWLMRALPRTHEGYALFNTGTAAIALAMMAPAAFFAGMTLPLFTAALIRVGDGGRSVGHVYSANTLGAIAGVLVTVHVLIPLTSLETTMIVAAAVDLALGLALLAHISRRIDGKLGALLAGSIAAVACTVAIAQFDPMAMAAGVYRWGIPRFVSRDASVLSYRDGKTASVAVVRMKGGEIAISTNGKADASIQPDPHAPATLDEATMALIGVLPLATHRAPKTAAVIGFGSGLTTHTLLGDPDLNSVDTIEIEPLMVDGARIFGKSVSRAFDDPRSRLHFDDAKAYFATSATRYDIIVSEPSNPWVSGVANLFSTEFYKFIPNHLEQGGLFVQWVQLYEIDDALVATIGRSLAAAFSDFRVYLADDTDAIIIATPHGSLPEMQADRLLKGLVGVELARVGILTQADLDVRFVGNRHSLLPLFDLLSERWNSDFRPVLALEAPQARFSRERSTMLVDMASADLPLREVLSDVAPVDADRVLANPGYWPSQVAAQSALIAGALVDPNPELPMAKSLVEVRAVIAGCSEDGNDGQKADALQQLAGSTIPFLDAARLKYVWIEPSWLNCNKFSDVAGAMLAVVAALARRDFGATGRNAVELLQQHRNALSQTVSDWLLRAAMLSAIAERRFADVGSLNLAFADIECDRAKCLQRRYLVAFAATQRSR